MSRFRGKIRGIISKASKCGKCVLFEEEEKKEGSRSSTSSSKGLSYSNHTTHGNVVQNDNSHAYDDGRNHKQSSKAPPPRSNRNNPQRELQASRTAFSRLQRERTRNLKQKSRSVMYKAMAYTAAWLLVVMWVILAMCLSGVYEKISNGADETNAVTFVSTFYLPLWLLYPAVIFAPFQGLYNLIIYLYPKVIAAKQKARKKSQHLGIMRQPQMSWWQAFCSVVSPSKKKSKRPGGGKKVAKKNKVISRSVMRIMPTPSRYADGHNGIENQNGHQDTPRSVQDDRHAQSNSNLSRTTNVGFTVVEEGVAVDGADIDLVSRIRMSKIEDESLISVRSSIKVVHKSSNVGISYATDCDDVRC